MDDSTQQKWFRLVRKLEFNTRSNALSWKTSVDEDNIFVKVGDNRIALSRTATRNSDEEHDYLVEIFNAEGQLVDHFSDEMAPGSYVLLRKIFLMAYRQASGADVVIDDILTKLAEDPDDLPF